MATLLPSFNIVLMESAEAIGFSLILGQMGGNILFSILPPQSPFG